MNIKWHQNHVLTDHGIEISDLRNAPTPLAEKVLSNEAIRQDKRHKGGRKRKNANNKTKITRHGSSKSD